MAIIHKCDTCDAVSPDKDGLFVANHWTEITVDVAKVVRNAAREYHYLICQQCMKDGIKLSTLGVRK